MRLILKLEPEAEKVNLPVHYNHLVQRMIYYSRDKALTRWLCEKKKFLSQGFLDSTR